MFVERFNNNRGFSFIELLLSLSIFSMIGIFLSHTVLLLRYHDYTEKFLYEMEWEVFVNQAKSELRTSEKIQINDQSIFLLKNGEWISYEKYKDLLRRRVDLQGHEVLLYSIASISFEKTEKGLSIQSERGDGTVHKADFYIPPHIEVED